MDLHVLIVDDDVTSRTLLARLVDKHHRLRLVDSCADPIEALHAMQEHQVDVIFLDVEMPQMSGLDLVRSLDHPPKIVLVSGNAGYAAEAFELDVVDYLVKPVTLPRFTKAVSRLMREAQAPRPADAPMFVRVDGRLIRISLDEIRWIEARGDYALIQTTDRSLLTHTTLKSLVGRLPADRFARVHRSFIVNLDAVADIDESTLVIGQKVIPIGSSYRSKFIGRLRLL